MSRPPYDLPRGNIKRARQVQSEREYFRQMALMHRQMARSAQRFGWRSEMFDHLKSAAYCVVRAVQL